MAERSWLRRSLALMVVLLGLTTAVLAQQNKPPKRSLPPEKFDKQTEEVFAGTAQDRLSGPRPSLQPATEQANGLPTETPEGPEAGFAWSKLISAETIEDEIKSHRADLTQGVRNVRAFRSGGNREARLRFSVIAAMFGIAAEYDGQVRWKKQALAARDAFALAGRNSKAADDNTYKESRRRSEDLDELIRGGSVEFQKADEPLKWDRVAERPPLMQRLEMAFESRLRPWTANAGEFRRHQQEVVHEVELMAALARVLQQEAYEYVDDEDYLAYCRELQEHAIAARTAAREQNLDLLQTELGEIAKSCSTCHEDYR